MESDNMEKKPITIKDIANLADVSTGTVHRALHGKKGVGEEMRARILQIAKENGYVPNDVAAALKRKRQRVFVAAPGSRASNRYFYSYVWKGFQDYFQQQRNFNIEVVYLPYYDVAGNNLVDELDAAFKHYNGEVDGVLVAGFLDERSIAWLRELIKKDIAVAIATDEVEGALINVQADYFQTGALAAELLSTQIPRGSKILVAAGGMDIRAHYLMAHGFEEYLRSNDTGIECIFVHGYGEDQNPQMQQRVEDLLDKTPEIRAMFSVNARGSVLLSEIVRKKGLAGKIRLVGNDLFDENTQSMLDGVMQNIIFKSPYQQACEAAKALFAYLLHSEKPIKQNVIIESNVIFLSNLKMYLH